jgi:hypothetical protein
MSPRTKAKAAELVTREAGRQRTRETDSRNRRAGKQSLHRSADQWFLDAAVYVRDGDAVNARAAALRGLKALELELAE